jgi:putative Ig domain-containing protein
MKRSSMQFSRGRRVAAFVSLMTLAALLIAPSGALADVSVRKATLNSGTLTIEGRGAKAGATITVSSPESTATGRANSRGEFRFSRSGYRSSTCKATVSDGSTSVVANLSGCTPSSTPPPPPPPTGSTPPTSVSLSHTSLDQVGNLAVAGVSFPPNPPVPLDFAVQSSHPSAAVPATVHVERFSEPGNPVASFNVTYKTAVTAPTSVTISVSAAGVTKTAVLTLNPPRQAMITPDVAELGPGYVGSDFTTHSSTTTTMTFGPGTLGPVRFEIIAGRLPNGLKLVDPNAGFTPAKSIHASVAGVPTTVETTTFTIKATDQNGLQATRTYTIRINPAITLAITPEQWAPLTVGSFGNLWIDGSGGVRPYRWALAGGQLPPGMSLIQDNPNGPLVRVGGTPTTAGTFTFTLRLTDAQSTSVSRTFSVTVS